MAATMVQIPSSNHIVPGSHQLADVSFPRTIDATSSNPREVANTWVSSFNSLVESGGVDVSSLFLKDSYWRDLLCLSWDFHTLHGPERIEALINKQITKWRIKSLRVDDSLDFRSPNVSSIDFKGAVKGIQSFLTVETDVGNGRGLVRLVQDQEDKMKWKVFTLFTTLEELTGFEALVDDRRPTGLEHVKSGSKNWSEMRYIEENFLGDRDPAVVIVGAGQGGLALAAQLKVLGIESLIIDRNPRIGDNWRNRYHQLVLHDTVWYDHMPFIPFPKNWPIFTPKDKLADWFESYAKAMELNIWCDATIKESIWDDTSRTWTLTVLRTDGVRVTRTLHPRHVVQATGASGEPNFPSDIQGIGDFKGDCLIHSTQFSKPRQNTKGKKAVVVGSCNSGHDIAQEYYQHGYDVTMVQRSSTLVVQCQTLIDVAVKGLYSDHGPPLDDADLINMSVPNPVAKRVQIDVAAECMRRDEPLLRSLKAAGFEADSGPDASGLWQKYMHRGGGYYIDVGASQLIADGKIKIKQGQGVSRVNPHSITLTDGSELEADEIVLATGFGNMRETARKIFGDALADRVEDVWGFDEEGETRTIWRRTGHPGFWFFGGNLAQCRIYSKLVALQIKALLEEVAPYEVE